MSEEKEEILLHKCRQDNCNVLETGQCLEGLSELEDCPHYYLISGESELGEGETIEDVHVEEIEYVDGRIQLYSGEELDLDNLKNITYQYKSKIVIIIGESNSGKTTLISTFLDMFQKGVFAGLLFAGSKTLVGFERKCHHSRISSNRLKPETERTISRNFNFLHLAVRDAELKNEVQHLLLSDVSGEKYRNAIDTNEDMMALNIVENADHILYILDGFKIINLKQRQNVKSNMELFIRRALEVGLFDSNTDLVIAICKWDYLVEDEKAIKFVSSLKEQTKQKFDDRLRSISFHQIAPRPENKEGLNKIELGYGLDELIKIWLNEKEFPIKEFHLNSLPKNDRESFKFLNRYERNEY